MAVTFATRADTMEFSSSERQTALLELFTSEGCSSCPPADRWLSGLKDDPGLWRDFVPLAFHVDYWNYLGWRDPLSRDVYSQRQRQYARNGYARSVYTPGFFIAGREWSGWFRNPVLTRSSPPASGTLTLRLTDHELTAFYQASSDHSAPLTLHMAVLGFDIRTDVTRGENRGKILTHDFVVLTWLRQEAPAAGHRWRIDRDDLNLSQPDAKAIAAWVSPNDDPTPIQATGGWLGNDQLNQHILKK